MRTIRATLVAFIALAVAMLPVAGANAHMLPSETSAISVQSDCCPHGQHCDEQGKGDCGKLAGCELKCSGFSAAIPMSSGIVPVPSPSLKTTLAVGSVPSPAYSPPAPPPRL